MVDVRLTEMRLTMNYEEARMLVDRLPVSHPMYREAQLWLNGFLNRALERLTVGAAKPITPTSASTCGSED